MGHRQGGRGSVLLHSTKEGQRQGDQQRYPFIGASPENNKANGGPHHYQDEEQGNVVDSISTQRDTNRLKRSHSRRGQRTIELAGHSTDTGHLNALVVRR